MLYFCRSWSLVVSVLVLKMAKRLVSDSVEDWIVKTLVYISVHSFTVLFRRKSRHSGHESRDSVARWLHMGVWWSIMWLFNPVDVFVKLKWKIRQVCVKIRGSKHHVFVLLRVSIRFVCSKVLTIFCFFLIFLGTYLSYFKKMKNMKFNDHIC